MIRLALSLLRADLEQYFLDRKLASTPDVQLGNVVDQDGKIVPGRLTLTLVNVEEETVGKRPFSYRSEPPADAYATHPSALSLNLFVLATAAVETNDSENETGKAYEGALTMLSATLEFFQAKPYFSHTNTPALDAKIDKLLVDLVSLTFQDQQNLWAYLGAKYMPSALFRVRMVTIDSAALNAVTPAVTQLDSRMQGKES